MSTVTASPDPLRAQLHQMWSGVAGAWGAHVAYVDARGQHVTDRLLELVQPRPGERVLELACGTGGPGLDAAPLVAPGGEVVISDFAAEMIAIAAGRIAELGLPNGVDARPRPRAHRRASRFLRRRPVPRGAHARPGPESCRARDPPHPPTGWPGRDQRVGPARAQPLARCRVRRGQRAAGRADAAAGHPPPLLARRRLRRAGRGADGRRAGPRPGRRALDAVPSGIGRRVVGAGPPPSRGRWHASSRRSPTRRRVPSGSGPRTRSAPTAHPPGSRSRACA